MYIALERERDRLRARLTDERDRMREAVKALLKVVGPKEWHDQDSEADLAIIKAESALKGSA